MNVNALGPKYSSDKFESDIESVLDTCEKLQVILDTIDAHDQRRRLSISFELATAFRYLDEYDLAYYWKTNLFSSKHHVYEILDGGWSNGEVVQIDVMNLTRASISKEYFVVTKNGCMNIISDKPPEIEWIDA